MRGHGGHADDDDLVLGKAYDARLMRRLLRYVLPWRWLGVLALALTAVLAAAQSLTPYLLGRAVDDGIVAGDTRALVWIAGILLAVEGASFGLLFLQQYLLMLLGQRIMRDLRLEVFDRVQRQSLAFFGRHPIGRLVTRVMNDVQAIAELFTTGIVAALGDVLAIGFAGGFLFWYDWRLALVTFCVLPVLLGVAFATKAKIRAAFREIRRLLARLNASLAENVAGVEVVQLFGRERRNLDGFMDRNDQHLRAQLGLVHWSGVFSTGITVTTLGTIAVLIWAGGESVLGGRLTIGVLVAFLGYAQRLFQPVRDMAEKYQIFQSAMASAERLFKLLDEEVSIVDPECPETLPEPVQGAVELRDVTFEYPAHTRDAGARAADGRAQALTQVSLAVRPGERLAIVGHTGAGKSTVINLIARFYDASAGEVLVDGVPVSHVRQRDLRQAMGLVLQDVFVFAGTVLQNLQLGTEIPEERCAAAARAVGADGFIRALPFGYRSELRERGANLSVGEKQLLSFARVLAHDPRILILDEATASVDPETEARLQTAVHTITEGRTSIVIAHRLATIRDADRVAVLHKGRLREMGTLDELLEKRGLFYALYRLQYPDAVHAVCQRPLGPDGRGRATKASSA